MLLDPTFEQIQVFDSIHKAMTDTPHPPRYRNQVPKLKLLFEELGCDATSQKRLQESAHHWRRNYVCGDGQEGKDLTDWRSKATLNLLNDMARDFLASDRTGAKFWPSDGKGCVGNGLRYPKDLQKICSLMQQVFWRQNEYEMRNAKHPDRHHALGKTRQRSEETSSTSSAEESVERSDRVGSAGLYGTTPSANSQLETTPIVSDEDLQAPESNSPARYNHPVISNNTRTSHRDEGNTTINARAADFLGVAFHSTLTADSPRTLESGKHEEIFSPYKADEHLAVPSKGPEASDTATSVCAAIAIDDDASRTSQSEGVVTPTVKSSLGRKLVPDDSNAMPRRSRRSCSSSSTQLASSRQAHRLEHAVKLSNKTRRMHALTPPETEGVSPGLVQNPTSPASKRLESSNDARPYSEPSAHLPTCKNEMRLSIESLQRPAMASSTVTGFQETPGSQVPRKERHYDMLRSSRVVEPHIRGAKVAEQESDGSSHVAISSYHNRTYPGYGNDVAATRNHCISRTKKNDRRRAMNKVQIRYTIIKSRTPALIKQNWRTNGLSGKTFEELCDEVAHFLGQPQVHRVHFQLLLEEVRFEYAVDRNEPEEFDEMRDIFTEEIKRDMKMNNNMRFEISLEPNPNIESMRDGSVASKDGHHDMEFTI